MDCMQTKRVLLIESGCFIGGVIHNLFESSEKFTIFQARPHDGNALILAVQDYNPDVVILDDTLKFDYLNDLLRYLSLSDDFRVIIVNTNANKIEVYQKNQIPVLQSADLFAMI
jgi:chemotaxis response regulator CheB